jgi:hypothetical protein
MVRHGMILYGVPTVESRLMRNIFARIRLCVVGDEKKIMHPDHGGSRTYRNVVRSMNLHVRLKMTASPYATCFREIFQKM